MKLVSKIALGLGGAALVAAGAAAAVYFSAEDVLSDVEDSSADSAGETTSDVPESDVSDTTES